MPQMAPMLWFILFLFFVFVYFVYMVNLYYFHLPKSESQAQTGAASNLVVKSWLW